MSIVTLSEIEKSLKEIGICAGDLVLVHSSLKSFGTVQGGAETVIAALKNVVTEEGTLVMPTFAQKNFPYALLEWSLDRPSDTGYITEVFRKMSDSLRSNQETHSVAAWGKLAHELTFEHKGYGPRYGTYTEWAFSKSSPWQKMYDRRAKVLFLGAPIESHTFKHFVEYLLVNEVLDNVEPELYDECKAQIKYSLLPNPNPQGIWPYYNAERMLEVFDKEGIVKYGSCGDAKLMLIDAYESCIVADKAIRSDMKLWMNEATYEWFRKYGKYDK